MEPLNASSRKPSRILPAFDSPSSTVKASGAQPGGASLLCSHLTGLAHHRSQPGLPRTFHFVACRGFSAQYHQQ